MNHESAPVYLDFAASTPCDESVIAEMTPYFNRAFGNPGNAYHPFGLQAHLAVEEARERAATLLCCQDQELIWTSGATEANNLALRGFAEGISRTSPNAPAHLISAAHEHKSVLITARELERAGWSVTLLKPPPSGVVNAKMVAGALRDNTRLVSVMAANNELGTLNDVTGIGALCREREIAFHCDATQVIGKLPFDVRQAGVDLLSWSAHKMYGPKGVGALFARTDRDIRLVPQLSGGGQEDGRRSGTLNVPGIVGLGSACQIAGERMEADATHMAKLRDRLEQALVTAMPGATINGRDTERVPNIASITLPLETDKELVAELQSVACSSGSACMDPSDGPSHVLRAIGVSGRAARNTLRLSVGRPTTANDIDRAVQDIVAVTAQLSPA